MKMPAAIMYNLLGEEEGFYLAHQLIGRALTIPGATVHWYDKPEMQKQRKMGHITIVGPSLGMVESQLNSMLNQEIMAEMAAGQFPNPVVPLFFCFMLLSEAIVLYHSINYLLTLSRHFCCTYFLFLVSLNKILIYKKNIILMFNMTIYNNITCPIFLQIFFIFIFFVYLSIFNFYDLIMAS
nr:TPA_asm: hypothetical protein HUJ06_021274 [Nelumbo nucifera]